MLKKIFALLVILIFLIVILYIFLAETTAPPSEIPVSWGEASQITQEMEVNSVQFLGNGQLLFVADDGVLIANADGSDMRTLFYYEGIRRANMSPDSSKIVFDNDLDIFVASPDGSNLQPVANDANLLEFAISFTPDGQAITFVTIDDLNSTYGIWIMDPEGSNKRKLLPSNQSIFRHPRQSPNGQRISYFTTGKNQPPRISVMNSDGSDSLALTDPAIDGPSRQASWSTDGSRFVYSSKKAGDFDLWIMDVNGDNKQKITSIQGDEAKPVFSPDGNTIAFVCSNCNGSESSDLYTITKK